MLGLASTKHDGKKLELVVLNGCETEDLGKVRHIAHPNTSWLAVCFRILKLSGIAPSHVRV